MEFYLGPSNTWTYENKRPTTKNIKTKTNCQEESNPHPFPFFHPLPLNPPMLKLHSSNALAQPSWPPPLIPTMRECGGGEAGVLSKGGEESRLEYPRLKERWWRIENRNSGWRCTERFSGYQKPHLSSHTLFSNYFLLFWGDPL